MKLHCVYCHVDKDQLESRGEVVSCKRDFYGRQVCVCRSCFEKHIKPHFQQSSVKLGLSDKIG